MNVNKVIDKVNALKSHSYDEKEVKGFIEECDKKIYREIAEHFDSTIETYNERYPLDGDDELIADDAYYMLYVWYAIAQIDLFNGETDRYLNDLILFNNYYNDFEMYFTRTHNYKKSKITRIITD